jgi:hypothetical protein
VAPGRVELPTFGLGNRCSIHLSYGAIAGLRHYLTWNREEREWDAVKALVAQSAAAVHRGGPGVRRMTQSFSLLPQDKIAQ